MIRQVHARGAGVSVRVQTWATNPFLLPSEHVGLVGGAWKNNIRQQREGWKVLHCVCSNLKAALSSS